MWGSKSPTNLNVAAKGGQCAAILSIAQGSTDGVGGGAGGADVNTTQMGGAEAFTPLLTAAANGHAEAVSLLVSLGADMDAKDRKGRTLEDISAGNPDVEKVVSTLRKAAKEAAAARARQAGPADQCAGDDYSLSQLLAVSNHSVGDRQAMAAKAAASHYHPGNWCNYQCGPSWSCCQDPNYESVGCERRVKLGAS